MKKIYLAGGVVLLLLILVYLFFPVRQEMNTRIEAAAVGENPPDSSPVKDEAGEENNQAVVIEVPPEIQQTMGIKTAPP
jgi:hypothetical protein